MLPPRYQVRLQTFDGVEVFSEWTKSDVQARVSVLSRWDRPDTYLYYEVQDSGQERGSFKAVAWCYLNDELGTAAKISKETLHETFERMKRNYQESLCP
jgi:hypothetical protein